MTPWMQSLLHRCPSTTRRKSAGGCNRYFNNAMGALLVADPASRPQADRRRLRCHPPWTWFAGAEGLDGEAGRWTLELELDG